MKYGLRKVNKDLQHYDFTWPDQVGSIAKCPDWNPQPECGGGLHFLPEAVGDYDLLSGHYWVVVEYDDTKAVAIDLDKAKVEECKIVYFSEDPSGLLEFFDANKLDSEHAYHWARDIGNHDVMIDRVTDSQWRNLLP